MAMASADMGGGAGYDAIVRSIEQEVASRQQKAEQAFRSFCEREQLAVSSDPGTAAPSAEWRMETGDEPSWLAEHGRPADLLVVGRARDGEAVDMGMLEAALMSSGRPVLIAPARVPDRIGSTVAIAWKNRREAALAVAAAQPFVATADQVIILSVDEGSGRDEQSCERLRYALTWQNAQTTVQHLKAVGGSAVETLLSAAGASGSDLLVMGGYGHSRVREVMFGGFTRRVLSSADLPVLMAH